MTLIGNKQVDLIINIPRKISPTDHQTDGYKIRRLAIDHHIPLITNFHIAQLFLQCLQGRLEGLNIAMIGDLKFSRTVHSLAQALYHFNARLYFVSHPTLEMPKRNCDELRERGVRFSFHKSVEEVIDKVDILYATRVQEERFAHKFEYEEVKDALLIKLSHLEKVKKNLKILHPLPRNHEIEREIDDTEHAYYFQQAQNGLCTRQALLALVLGKI